MGTRALYHSNSGQIFDALWPDLQQLITCLNILSLAFVHVSC